MEENQLRGEMQTHRHARAIVGAELDGAVARGLQDKARLLRLGALAALFGQQTGSLASAMKERGVEDATVREAEKLGHFFQGIVGWIANWIDAEQDQERQVTSLAK